MQFLNTLLIASAALLSTVSAADGIFAIEGSGRAANPSRVYLKVYNGVVGEAAKCSGTVNFAKFPATGNVPCVAGGYALSFKWDTKAGAIAATYKTPTSPAFTYNVPNKGCSGDVCTFGFSDIFPQGKLVAREFEG